MTDEAAFLQAIIAAPDDDSIRLVYADWLEERGDCRGEFLRLLHQRAAATARLKQLLPGVDPAWVQRISRVWAGERQMLPAPIDSPRVETGAVQFGDDWPGLFIRGDNALALMVWIRSLCELLRDHPNEDVADRLDRLKQYADLIDQSVRA
jgi:uncharacterized protein (TIGR02996 family)